MFFYGTDGTIRGGVTDENNNPLPGATIQIPDLGIGAMADVDGNYIDQWRELLMPGDVWIKDEVFYVVEQTEQGGVSIWTKQGELITRWYGDRGPGKGSIISGHGITVDSEGSIYVAELTPAERVSKFQKI